MEEVLAVYPRPDDPSRPVVCLDETSRQVRGEARSPQPPAPGRPARQAPEDVRGGVVTLFLATEPLRGGRTVTVGERRTRLDFAACVNELVDGHYPEVEQLLLALDQLTTHSPAARSAAFPAAVAKHIAIKLELHHTPKHGSWLNMAEIEVSALERQRLRQRLADYDAVERATSAWAARRNAAGRPIAWQVTTADARTGLRQLDPAFED